MSVSTPTANDLQGGESAVRRQMAAAKRRIGRLKKIDRAAVGIITLGGVAVIISVIGILIFIGAEALPLFKSARASQLGTIRLAGTLEPASPAHAVMGTDESGRYLYDVTPSGTLTFFATDTGARAFDLTPPTLSGATITTGSRSLSGDFIAFGTSDGRVAMLMVSFLPVYEGGVLKNVTAQLVERGIIAFDPEKRPLRRVSYLEEGDNKILAGQVVDNEIKFWWSDPAGQAREAVVQVEAGQKVTALRVGRSGTVIAGTDRGTVYHWELGDTPTLTDVSKTGSAAITALSYVIGSHTFVVGTADGNLSAWFRAPVGADGALGLVRAVEFGFQGSAITDIAASTRDRTFAAASADGRIVLRHQTSGRVLLTLPGTTPATHVVLTPRSDGLVAVRSTGEIDRFAVANPHPEISWRTLFGKVWYEGYAAPEYVWQSSGGTDDAEPKLSLVPLIFGTIKGTVYALIFAIPLAVFGALYTSQFVHPSIRARIKPTVEIMAALPSVVIGFIAGLYLAPVVERNLVGVILLMLVLPIVGTSAMFVWNVLPTALRRRVRVGGELVLIIPLVLFGGWLALALAPTVEAVAFGGDARQWLANLGITYDQRNSLVVGVAMGFAVIPIIFTISEDAFSSVPSNLGAASLALGASRWQTAIRVVVPTASPGVFSAVMVGFGRAVGETMIVLMATGNTPVMDWSIFNGFRTLSANIAVEIPEAPQGGTLYRTLFLSAALLFVMTFTLNTIAEVIRQRLRERYKAI
ncbi:MAG TPA: ABC transporter permease subunit [Vicinamibacterales bacterium]|nr:ABC transporter permease subunit [Vicinamibacterales bacterium]